MEPGVQSKFRMTERRNVIYRKYLQSVFCIALVLTVLTGCGKNTGQTSRSTEKKEIDIPIILTVDPTSGKKTKRMSLMHLMKNMPVRIICKWNGSWRRKRNTEKI